MMVLVMSLCERGSDKDGNEASGGEDDNLAGAVTVENVVIMVALLLFLPINGECSRHDDASARIKQKIQGSWCKARAESRWKSYKYQKTH